MKIKILLFYLFINTYFKIYLMLYNIDYITLIKVLTFFDKLLLLKLIVNNHYEIKKILFNNLKT